ncbi:hypothetical protein FOL47_003449 [Perkinsus chesapeaki]|uniref:Uncharacterized protein n=1 Tax=Perkinsus chesapeaki TaxID=330153 RepID=A0A7J6KML2_PERCH|nr:hypothetical protein FOL47_003449 [Perkinsus chesapeaki]
MTPNPKRARVPSDHDTDPLSTAKKALVDSLDVWVPLPGAPHYRARLRRLLPGEHKDDPAQLYVFEIDWDDIPLEGKRLTEYQRFARRSKVDYKVPMLRQLSQEENQCFTDELSGMINRNWWREGVPTSDEKPLDLPCCTFPLSQGSHKTTRIRLCSDMRGPNLCLPVASYSGHSVPEVLGILRARVGPKDHLELVDLQKAFYMLRLARRPRDTKEFLDIGGGVSALPYYDDIALFGDRDRVVALRELLVAISPLIGAACPPEKRDSIDVPVPDSPNQPSPVRHMGAYWSRAEDGRLLLRCVEGEELCLPSSDAISRREVFSLAGTRYDGVLCHPCCRAAGCDEIP